MKPKPLEPSSPTHSTHHPPTAIELRHEALRLLREGHDEREVADALGVDPTSLHQLVGQCLDCA